LPINPSKAGFSEDDVIKDVGIETELIDKLACHGKRYSMNLKNMVKMQPHQSKKRTEERLSMLKVIAKTSDKTVWKPTKRG
jgi:hypothetical protein